MVILSNQIIPLTIERNFWCSLNKAITCNKFNDIVLTFLEKINIITRHQRFKYEELKHFI